MRAKTMLMTVSAAFGLFAGAGPAPAAEEEGFIPVDSQIIESVNYENENGTLHVRFRDGREVSHHGVPRGLYEQFISRPVIMGGFYKGRIARDFPTDQPNVVAEIIRPPGERDEREDIKPSETNAGGDAATEDSTQSSPAGSDEEVPPPGPGDATEADTPSAFEEGGERADDLAPANASAPTASSEGGPTGFDAEAMGEPTGLGEPAAPEAATDPPGRSTLPLRATLGSGRIEVETPPANDPRPSESFSDEEWNQPVAGW